MTDAALSTRPPITEEGRRLGLGTKTYLYVSMTIVAAIVIVPLLTTVLGGFKTMPDLRGDPFGLPREWQWQNYGGILFSQRYWLQMGNSLLIACLTVFLTLVCGAMAAFTFAHMRFFGSGFFAVSSGPNAAAGITSVSWNQSNGTVSTPAVPATPFTYVISNDASSSSCFLKGSGRIWMSNMSGLNTSMMSAMRESG